MTDEPEENWKLIRPLRDGEVLNFIVWPPKIQKNGFMSTVLGANDPVLKEDSPYPDKNGWYKSTPEWYVLEWDGPRYSIRFHIRPDLYPECESWLLRIKNWAKFMNVECRATELLDEELEILFQKGSNDVLPVFKKVLSTLRQEVHGLKSNHMRAEQLSRKVGKSYEGLRTMIVRMAGMGAFGTPLRFPELKRFCEDVEKYMLKAKALGIGQSTADSILYQELIAIEGNPNFGFDDALRFASNRLVQESDQKRMNDD